MSKYLEWVNEMENLKLSAPKAFEYAVSRMTEDERSCLIGEGIIDG